MKKSISFLAVAMMVTTFHVDAQVTVKSNGFMDIGENPDTLYEHMGSFSNRIDTISMLRTIKVTERGVAGVTINVSDLNAGMYIYSLVADGREIDTKRMILTK